jgi:hypothetical protein
MHGADRDIIWLQRDFRVYVCNLFDTGQVLVTLELLIPWLLSVDLFLCLISFSFESYSLCWTKTTTRIMERKGVPFFCHINLSVTFLSNTDQASRVLQMERNSLEYLLHHFCGVTANKVYSSFTHKFWKYPCWPLLFIMKFVSDQSKHFLVDIKVQIGGWGHSLMTWSSIADINHIFHSI